MLMITWYIYLTNTPKMDISLTINLQVGGANGKKHWDNWRNYGLNIWEQIEGQPLFNEDQQKVNL